MPKILDSFWIKVGYFVDTHGLNDADRVMSGLGSRIGGIAAGLTTVATLAAGLGAAAYSAGSAAEQAFTRLQTQIGLTADQSARARTALRGYSRETGQSLANLAEGYFALESAGLGAAKSMEITEIAARAAAAQFGAGSDISRLLGGVLTVYPDLQAEKAADQFAAAIRYGNIKSAGELATAIPTLLSMTDPLGVTFGETLAAVASLTLVFPDATRAVTGLRGVLNEFLNPTAQARDVLAEFGLTADDLRATLDEQGIIKTLQWLWEVIGQDAETMAKLIERSEGLQAALTLVGAQAERFVEIEKGVINASGLVNEAFEIQSETATTKLSIAMNKLSLRLEAVWHQMAGVVDVITSLPDTVLLLLAAMTALQAVLIVFTTGGGGGILGIMFKSLLWVARGFFIDTAATNVNTAAKIRNFIAQRLLFGWVIRAIFSRKASAVATATDTAATAASTTATTADTAARRGFIATTFGAIAATVRWTFSKIVDIAVSTAHRTAIIATTAATWAAAAAKTAVTVATWAWNVALAAGRGLLVLTSVAAVFLSGTLAGTTIAMLAAKAAVWLLNFALYAMPIIGWIGLLVAAILALVVFRKQVLAVVKFLLGWLRENWPLILFPFTGPFAIILRVIWGFRSQILSIFQSLLQDLLSFLRRVWPWLIAPLLGPLGVFLHVLFRFRDNVLGVFKAIWSGATSWIGKIGDYLGRVAWWVGLGPSPSERARLAAPGVGAVPVGAAGVAGGGSTSSVNIDSVNVNVEHGDAAEIAANMSNAISEEARNLAVTSTAGQPLR